MKKRGKDEAKHDSILKAAIRLFPKQGFAGTSMDSIATAAGVTKQTVYGHFQSKDELFKSMIIALCEGHRLPEKLPGTGGRSIEEYLYEAGLNFLNFVTSSETLAVTRLVISEVPRHPKLAERYYEDGTQRLVNLFAAFLKEQNKLGALHIPDVDSATSCFFAQLKGKYYLRMILGIKPLPTQKDKELNVRETVAIFMRLYGGKNALHTRSTL